MLISLLWEFSLGQLFREVETATRWSDPFHSRWHNVLPRVPFPPLKGLREPEESQGSYKGSSHDGVVTRLGGRIARVLSSARLGRLILGGSLGDTHPCSTFAGNLFLLFSSISLSGTFAEFHSDLVTRFCNTSLFFLCSISL